ncbi:MAG TPA: FAD/NAD(P)-binding protein [Iamia sp.]|jgi:uncharacterized NAD(P)/FAD-binding protein YdhS|nr:FAD/NAD(P)-binding protein [Iamia sp.]
MSEPFVVGIVGAGPRGLMVLERLLAHAAVGSATRPLVVHLVDPHPSGAGRVWRHDQSALLRLNSTAEDVTAFPDRSVAIDGPVRTGPTLAEWAALVPPGALCDPALEAEAAALGPLDFASRRLASAYFGWVRRHLVDDRPGHVEVRSWRAGVVDVVGAGDRERIVLDDGTSLDADAVVLTLGHLDAEPDPARAAVAAACRHAGVTYLPPGYAADMDLEALAPAEDVVVRGIGLAFVDLLVLLTEGRGGRFTATPGSAGLTYHPSGAEPRLLVGSRRGAPYHCKPGYRLRGGPAPGPRFLTPAAVDALLAGDGPLEFRRDVWPVVAREIAWHHYHELVHGHPGRVAVAWPEFDARFAAAPWGSDEQRAVVARLVPHPVDRFDVDDLERPLGDVQVPSLAALQTHLQHRIRIDVDRRGDARFSPDLGAFFGFLAVFPALGRILSSPRLDPRSLVGEFEDWWFGLFSAFASGPPPERLEQLLALSRAGIVTFLGADVAVEVDAEAGVVRARSSTHPVVVEGRALVDAVLPAASVARTRSPLLAALRDRGEVRSAVLTAPDGTTVDTGRVTVEPKGLRLVDAQGRAHPRRFAVGPHTTARAPAFARVGTNAPTHHHDDAVARAVLALAAVDSEPVAARP